MKTTKRVFTVIFKSVILIGVLFIVSCSSDDDGDCSDGIAKLPASAVGTYTGVLQANGINTTSGTAKVAESSCNNYTISFNNGVSSITGIKFVRNDNAAIYKYIETGVNRTIVVTITDDGDLIVQQTSAPVIQFAGAK